MKLISIRCFTVYMLFIAGLFWVLPGHAIELWQVEEDHGRLRAVIHTYSPENPQEMTALRKLVAYFDRFEIPSTDQTPAQWLTFRHGPHAMLKQALGDESTPPAVLSAYIGAYRASLKTFLDDVVYADPSVDEDGGAASGVAPIMTASTAFQAEPEIAISEVQTESVGALSSQSAAVQTEDVELMAKTVGTVDRYMARLRERLPVETRRIVAQVQAQAERLQERAPIEIARVGTQIQQQAERLQERAPIELRRLEQQSAELPGKVEKELKRLFKRF